MTRAIRHLMYVAYCLSAFSGSGCTTHESVECRPCECGFASSSLDGDQRFEESLPDLTSALQLFGVAEDSAARAILQLAESPEHQKLLCVCDMSEQEWVAHWGDAWERQRDVLVRRLTHLRFLANQLVGRAVYLKSLGEKQKAATILRAVKRLGAANRGPGVPLVCDIVGKAIEELADKSLAAMPE